MEVRPGARTLIGYGKPDTNNLDTPSKPRNVDCPQQNTLSALLSPEKKDVSGSFDSEIEYQGTPTFGPSPRALLLMSVLYVVLTNAFFLHVHAKDESSTLSSTELAGRIFG